MQHNWERVRQLPLEHMDRLRVFGLFATQLKLAGDFSSARKMYEESLPVLQRVLGRTHVGTLHAVNNFAFLLSDMGELDAALPLLIEGMEATREGSASITYEQADLAEDLRLKLHAQVVAKGRSSNRNALDYMPTPTYFNGFNAVCTRRVLKHDVGILTDMRRALDYCSACERARTDGKRGLGTTTLRKGAGTLQSSVGRRTHEHCWVKSQTTRKWYTSCL